MTQAVTPVTDAFFKTEVEQAELPVFIDFWAPWCQPCKSLEPVLEYLARSYLGRIKFTKVNVDENPELKQRFDIRSLPTMILFKNDQTLERISGAQPKAKLSALLDLHVTAAEPATMELARPSKVYRAFWGDADLQKAVATQVRQHIEADQVVTAKRVPICDEENQKYSLMGAALHAADMDRYEGTLGIPAVLAQLEEAVHSLMMVEVADGDGKSYDAFREQGCSYPVDWLQSIPLGADLRRVTPHFLHWLLLDLISAPYLSAFSVVDDAKSVVRDVAALHARTATGTMPNAAEWKAAREAAIDACPNAQEHLFSFVVVQLASAVAWPDDELNDGLVDGLDMFFKGLSEASVMQMYTAEEWAKRDILKAAASRRIASAEPGTNPKDIESSEEVVAFMTMWESAQPVDDAQRRKIKRELGERLHQGLMKSLCEVAKP
ncbi:thioredoxin [Undibacterium sp.]|uniref:thioredoxin n=1 Tax=Undibacterium sp. TaxID=1914977 RepID=UPI002C3C049F|nr:thioredoxin [Undibacterium sp.]HTD03878.1 thioredoxin [Undibacterium sp.]